METQSLLESLRSNLDHEESELREVYVRAKAALDSLAAKRAALNVLFGNAPVKVNGRAKREIRCKGITTKLREFIAASTKEFTVRDVAEAISVPMCNANAAVTSAKGIVMIGRFPNSSGRKVNHYAKPHVSEVK